jgi:hypothetical protein
LGLDDRRLRRELTPPVASAAVIVSGIEADRAAGAPPLTGMPFTL